MTMPLRKPKCGECGSKMIPIIYGLPGDSLFKKAERGEIYLGGCVIWLDAPDWACPSCKVDEPEEVQGG